MECDVDDCGRCDSRFRQCTGNENSSTRSALLKVQIREQVFTQRFNLTWKHIREGDTQEALPRSGNPGYTPGLPIIGAVEENGSLKKSKVMLFDAGELRPWTIVYNCTLRPG